MKKIFKMLMIFGTSFSMVFGLSNKTQSNVAVAETPSEGQSPFMDVGKSVPTNGKYLITFLYNNKYYVMSHPLRSNTLNVKECETINDFSTDDLFDFEWSEDCSNFKISCEINENMYYLCTQSTSSVVLQTEQFIKDENNLFVEDTTTLKTKGGKYILLSLSNPDRNPNGWLAYVNSSFAMYRCNDLHLFSYVSIETKAQLCADYHYISNEEDVTDEITADKIEGLDKSRKNFSYSTTNADYLGFGGNENGKLTENTSELTPILLSKTSAGTLNSIIIDISLISGSTVEVYATNTKPKGMPSSFHDWTLIKSETSKGIKTITFEESFKYFCVAVNGYTYFNSFKIEWHKTILSVDQIIDVSIKFASDITDNEFLLRMNPTGTCADQWKAGFAVALNNSESIMDYYYLNKASISLSENPIEALINGLSSNGNRAKYSMYAETMDKLPGEGSTHQYSVKVAVPNNKTYLETPISAVWFAFNSTTKEFFFASQKNLSVKDMVGIYLFDPEKYPLTDDQYAFVNHLKVSNEWAY